MRLVRLAFLALLAASLFGLAAVCAGAALAAQFGRTDPVWDILTHFAPLWFAGAAVALLAGMAFRGVARTLIVAMAVAGVVAAGALMAPELFRSTGPRAPHDAADQLKVVQFNLWYGNADLDRVADWLAEDDVDIAVLQEARPDVRQVVEARTRLRLVAQNWGVMIFSRTEPVRDAPPQFTLTSPGPLVSATFRDARGQFTVVGVHNVWPTEVGKQQVQERRLARLLSRLPVERTIVAGDFNSAPWSFSRRRWDEAFGVIRRDRALFTWPTRPPQSLRRLGVMPFLPIDHVYAGADWATVRVERGPRLGSDHYPVIVTLAPLAPR